MKKLEYGYEVTLSDVPFDAVLTKTIAALKEEGFGVLTRIDMTAAMKEKLGVDMGRRYEILGACNPPLAHQAVSHDRFIGLLLPCNVVVQEVGSLVSVAAIDPRAMFSVVDDPALEPIVADVKGRLTRVLAALAG